MLLDVQQPDLGAERLELVAVLLAPHQRHRLVAVPAELGVEMEGHLAVAADNRYSSHGPTVRARWAPVQASVAASESASTSRWAGPSRL
ncbi:hypothetical protein BJZ21_001959 [Nocardioides panaciterrulae]|uniref:Uncharacterized protein n=1 Tax=Nocardioides panaciterrulae TaxID=661492 RepID=A0A7Y9E601_9ACTN|nr:hypothetical protein [Nocardioides panaciterrulae]